MSACTTIACHNVLQNPKATKHAAVRIVPSITTGFLPTRSDNHPQKKFVANCASANEDAIVPTYNPIYSASTSGKVEVISGRYGDIELRAVCSAKAMIASIASCFFGKGEF
jgi:hypothetical protein